MMLYIKKYIPSLSVIKLFLFVGIAWAAVVGPFQSILILKNLGATSPQIGIFTAVCSVISMVLQPVWGYVSDKIGSPRKVLCICLGVSAVFFGSLLLTENLYIAMAMIIMDIAFRCGIISLLDSHTLSEMNVTPGLQYSFIRMAGSVFFGLMSLIYSGIINANGVMAIIPVSLSIAAAAICWGLFAARGKWETERGEGGVLRAKPNLKKEALTLLRDMRYILFIVFVALYSLSMSPLFVFIIEFVLAVDGHPGDVPMIHALRCMVELPIFILIGAAGKRLGAKKLMLAGLCFGFIYLTGLLLAYSFTGLIVSHMFGAAGFILCLTGRMRYINEITPEAVRSTSITIMGACEIGLGSIAGNLIAGFVIGLYGTQALTWVSVTALAVALAMLAVIAGLTKMTKAN
jgi:PPP family 3-phenylpropionic acid transporter